MRAHTQRRAKFAEQNDENIWHGKLIRLVLSGACLSTIFMNKDFHTFHIAVGFGSKLILKILWLLHKVV